MSSPEAKSSLTYRVLCYLLILVGLLQTIGLLCKNNRTLRILGFATASSPLPEVFGKMQGHEPMAYFYKVDLIGIDGKVVTLPFKRKEISTLLSHSPGHLNRFSPYFFAINWGPVLDKRIRDHLMIHGFCTGGPVAVLLGMNEPVKRVSVTLTPRSPHEEPKYFEVTCPA